MSRKSRMNEVRNAAAQQQAAIDRRNRWIMMGVAAVVIIALIVGVSLLTRKPSAADTPVASHWVEIDVKDYGVITAELYENIAPITVNNFVKLVNEGFYDGLTFHRIIEGFMMQGGDPNGDGTGGSPERIKGEFSANGWDNPLKHERGVLSMARQSYPLDSASSQFFIMHQAARSLDGQYASFGRVLTGMEIVDAICAETPVVDNNGTVAAGYKPVINSIRLVEKPAE